MNNILDYTDVWVKGQVIKIGQRVSAPRFDALRPLLGSFKRRFSLLDIGCSTGYFGFRAASEYDCVVTMIGDEDITDLCEQNDLPHLMFLNHHFTVKDLNTLADCEHFDVVLALNIIHHFDDWEEAFNAIKRMGDYLVIETPGPKDRFACGRDRLRPVWDAVVSNGARFISTFESHTDPEHKRFMVLHETPKHSLTRPFIGSLPGDTTKLITNESEKYACIRNRPWRSWIEGINLWTFWLMSGVWPPRQKVLEQFRNLSLPVKHHGDFFPHNVIFDGCDMHLINGRDENANFEDIEAKAEGVRRLEEKL